MIVNIDNLWQEAGGFVVLDPKVATYSVVKRQNAQQQKKSQIQ
jgi:hypothetical protein